MARLPIAIDPSSRYAPILQQELTALKTQRPDFYHGLLGVITLDGTGNIPPIWFAPTEMQARKASREALLQRAQEGMTAGLLLERASLREDVAPQAHAVTLAIALSHGIRIDAQMDSALLQVALQAEQSAVPVIGETETIDALIIAPKAECCKKFQTAPMDEKRLRNCFVSDYLQLGLRNTGKQVEACGGESPWRKGRIWTEEESTRALALFQSSSKAYKGDPGSELDKALRGLDPAQSPSLRQRLTGVTLTRAEAQRVLELVWTAWSGRQAHMKELSVEELDNLDRFVDQIVRQDGRAPAAADGAL